MAEREYKDSEGNVVTLDKLVRIEPEWAASIIRWYESQLDATKKRAQAAEAALERTIEAWDRVDFANLRQVLEGSRETLFLSKRFPPREDKRECVEGGPER